MGKEPCPRERLIEPCLQEAQEKNVLGMSEEQPEASAVAGG